MDTTALTIILSAIVVGLVSYWFFLKQKDKSSLDQVTIDVSSYREKLKSLEERVNTLTATLQLATTSIEASLGRKIESLERKALSESRVRELIIEETKELKGEMRSLSELISKLRVDLGILNYINNK